MKKSYLLMATILFAQVTLVQLAPAQSIGMNGRDLFASNTTPGFSVPEIDRLVNDFQPELKYTSAFAGELALPPSDRTQLDELAAGRWMLAALLCLNRDRFKRNIGGISEERINTIFKVQALVGYFIATNLALGLGVGYDFDKSLSFNDTYTLNRLLFVAPFLRYYYFFASQVALVAQLKFPIGFVSGEDRFFDPISSELATEDLPSYVNFGAWLTPIIAWYMTERLALEFSLGRIGFETGSYDQNDISNTVSALAFKIAYLQPTLGFTYLIK